MKNAFGEEIPDETPDDKRDPWWVPPEERLEKDNPTLADANALTEGDNGDDLGGWKPAFPSVKRMIEEAKRDPDSRNP